MTMGYTAKVFVFYETAFWRERGQSGEAICASTSSAASAGPLTFVVDNSSLDGGIACLLGFRVGAPGRAAGELSPDARKAATLAQLERYFGASAASPIDYVEHDWADEPWTYGCPVASTGLGGLTQHGHALRAPVGRIHWAGTETAEDFCGYMEGALEAGERAADEVLAEL